MDDFEREMLAICEAAADESDILDFKREFSPHLKAAFWAETVKDIVAFANTRGGAIVFGINDDGTSSGEDSSHLLTFDNAKILDQVRRYTDADISLSTHKVLRAGAAYPALLIRPVNIPIVFTKPGTYEVEVGKQKTAFSVGTIYVRHGSKSETCTRDDLRSVLDRRLTEIRQEWLGNIRKVVEAEPGAVVVVASGPPTVGFRITDDPTAPSFRFPNLSEKYPFRQSDVISRVNTQVSTVAKINSHDIQTIKHCEKINHASSPEFMHKPHDAASPQYSQEFIDMLVTKIKADPQYLQTCRSSWTADRYDK